jgi:hypothetical protein
MVRSLAAGGAASNAAAAQNAGSTVLYAGMAGAADGGGNAGGHLFSIATADTATNGTTWTDLSLSPVTDSSGGFNAGHFDISSLAVDPHDATGETIYATIMGFAGNGINATHVYRSLDGGAHWVDISSNLPNAPANSVVIDPNDANTVYVALDTGVYVTSNVSDCPTVNCWDIYGAGLPNAPVTQLAAAVDLPTGDGRTGELRAATYGRGIWQIPLLKAASGPPASVTLAPAALNFPPQAVATVSDAQTITVTNSGSTVLAISSITFPDDFSETDTCAANPVAVGASCSIQIRFQPTLIGGQAGILTLYGNVAGGQATVPLSGTGTAGSAIVLTPLTVKFPSTTINASSTAQNITISNTSSSALAMQTPVVTGADFTITADTCGASLGPDTGCTVAIAFTPKSAGQHSGTLTVADAAGTQTALLSGAGTSPPTDVLSPLAVTFGAQQIDTASSAQQIVLTNSGDQPLTLIAAEITSGDFTVTNACGNSLSAHSSCAINVVFAPKNVGLLAGVLTISDQYRSQTVALSGFGLAPPGVSLAPFGTVEFPSTGVGIISAGQTVTLTNNVGTPLQIQSTAIAGDFAIVEGSSTCGSSLGVNSACTMQVVFSPTAGGPRAGTLTVTDTAPNSPQVLSLNGAGVDFTLTSNGPSNVTVKNGQSAVFPLLLSSAANVSGTVTFACTGMPANSTCNVTPGTVALGNTTTISVTVLTGASTSSIPLHRAMWRTGGVWFAFLFPIGIFGMRKFRLSRLGSLALLCLLLAASGCGAGRTIPAESLPSSGSGTGPVTASGTYTVVASASCAGLIRNISLTLVVQ